VNQKKRYHDENIMPASATQGGHKKASDESNLQKLNVFGHPGGGCNPSPTKLGMVIEHLEHVLVSRKLLGV